MPTYKTTWLDYTLPTGEDFGVAICGYRGSIRHMTFGSDVVRRMFVTSEIVDKECNVSQHCLDLECPLNHTQRDHIMHMLDMAEDEKLDEETAEKWGTGSAIDGMLKFINNISQGIPGELKKQNLIQ